MSSVITGTVQQSSGYLTEIRHAPDLSLSELAKSACADVAIMSTEEGFSTLGMSREFLHLDLGWSYGKVKPLAVWNRDVNENVSLIALPSRKQNSLLRGVILAPGDSCLSYQSYSSPYGRKPYRDYYYNVAYEAFSYVCKKWGAQKIALSQLCGSGRHHIDMATCQLEALIHFCDEFPKLAPHSITFFGCCIEKEHLDGLGLLEKERGRTKHKPIRIHVESKDDAEILNISWRTGSFETSRG